MVIPSVVLVVGLLVACWWFISFVGAFALGVYWSIFVGNVQTNAYAREDRGYGFNKSQEQDAAEVFWSYEQPIDEMHLGTC